MNYIYIDSYGILQNTDDKQHIPAYVEKYTELGDIEGITMESGDFFQAGTKLKVYLAIEDDQLICRVGGNINNEKSVILDTNSYPQLLEIYNELK